MSGTTKYFWVISAEFVKNLDEPVREYHEHSYTIRTQETGNGFMGDVYEASEGERVTRIGLLNYAIGELLKSQNKARRAAGKAVMFDTSNVLVRFFDCGNNEL